MGSSLIATIAANKKAKKQIARHAKTCTDNCRRKKEK